MKKPQFLKLQIMHYFYLSIAFLCFVRKGLHHYLYCNYFSFSFVFIFIVFFLKIVVYPLCKRHLYIHHIIILLLLFAHANNVICKRFGFCCIKIFFTSSLLLLSFFIPFLLRIEYLYFAFLLSCV